MDCSVQYIIFLFVLYSGVFLNLGDKIFMGNWVFEFKLDMK